MKACGEVGDVMTDRLKRLGVAITVRNGRGKVQNPRQGDNGMKDRRDGRIFSPPVIFNCEATTLINGAGWREWAEGSNRED